MLKNKKIYFFTAMFFLITILMGAILLKLPICYNSEISYLDAIFEATSGVSTTGTTVVDISKEFTFWGQLVIIVLTEIGAIGFMTFFYFYFMINKKKMKLSNAMIIENETNLTNYQMIKVTVKKIIQYTLVIELFGAWLLAFRLIPIYGFLKGVWYSLFHSISAYCNAGFDLLGNSSFLPMQNDRYFNSVIIVLMILGSLGFFVLQELTELFCKRKKISLQSKIILVVSFSIIIIGTILIKIFNQNVKIFDALFSVISARNTGFYTIEMNKLSSMNKMILTIIMFIGGGPISNAGGIKVNVFAILILTVIADFKNRDEIVIAYRSINYKTLRRCVTILVVDLFIIMICSMLFTLSDGKNVMDVLFYIVSSFSTTGLSTIDVSKISFAGKWISIFIMYIGRIAPITFVSLFVPMDHKKSGIKYPNMDVML